MNRRNGQHPARHARTEGRIRLFRTVRVSVTVALLVLLALNTVGVFLTLERAERERLEVVGRIALQSVAGSFEIVLGDMRAAAVQASRSPDLAQLLATYDQSVSAKLQISRQLSEFAAYRPFVRNVRLRVNATGEVFSTDQGVGTYSFADPKIRELDAGLYQSDPTLSDSTERPRVNLQIAAPVPLDSTEPRGVLVLDVDFESMTSHLLDATPGADVASIVIRDESGERVYPLDLPAGIPAGARPVGSIFSSELGWRLESYIPATVLRRLGGTSLSIALPLLVGSVGATLAMAVVLMVIRRPMTRIAAEYQSRMLQRYLIERSISHPEFVREVVSASSGGASLRYTVVLLELAAEPENGDQVGDVAGRFVDSSVEPLVPYRFTVNRRTSGLLLAGPARLRQPEFDSLVREWATAQIAALGSTDIVGGVYVGIGGSTESSRDVPNCFHQATTALRHKIHASEYVIQFHERMATSQAAQPRRETEQRLVEAVCTGAVDRAGRLCDEYLNELLSEDEYLPDDRIRSELYRFQSAVHRRAHEEGLYGISSVPLDLERYSSAVDLRASICGFVSDSASRVREASEHPTRADQIMAIIEESWHDPDFNLNALCDRLELNRSYVGRLIKEKSGRSFSEIVTEHRVRFAKEQLKEGVSVEQAAQLAGYRYPTYFIRVFKESEGLTPGQFREAQLRVRPD